MKRSAYGVGLGVLLAVLASPLCAAAGDQVEAVQAIADCRKIAEDAARLACFDKATGAFVQAQSKGDVVVVAREHVQQVRRQAFGFSMPSLDLFGSHGGAKSGEGIDRVTLDLTDAHKGRDGNWIMEAAGGAVWRQMDGQELFRDPRAGSKVLIVHGALGSFFCQVDGGPQMRCTRMH